MFWKCIVRLSESKEDLEEDSENNKKDSEEQTVLWRIRKIKEKIQMRNNKDNKKYIQKNENEEENHW